MNSNPTTFAIIGCGASTEGKGGAHSIAYAHAAGAKRAGLKLVAAASRTEKNRNDFAAEFPGCTPYADWRAMVAAEKPRLVSVCAFPGDREAMALELMEMGVRAILLEKPIATSVAAARRIAAAAQACGARVFVHHQRRYGLPFNLWRDAITGGRIGRVDEVQINLPFPALVDFGSHLVDAALYALAPRTCQSVQAAVERSADLYQGSWTERGLCASAVFGDGVRLAIETHGRPTSPQATLRAIGSDGIAEVHLSPADPQRTFRLVTSSGIEAPAMDETFHHGVVDKVIYVERALADIDRALASGAATRIDLSEALPGFDILMACFESARTGRRVALPLAQTADPRLLPWPGEAVARTGAAAG
jgi:UDP-N-acetylglucosamine 3-dehydrogenase